MKDNGSKVYCVVREGGAGRSFLADLVDHFLADPPLPPSRFVTFWPNSILPTQKSNVIYGQPQKLPFNTPKIMIPKEPRCQVTPNIAQGCPSKPRSRLPWRSRSGQSQTRFNFSRFSIGRKVLTFFHEQLISNVFEIAFQPF